MMITTKTIIIIIMILNLLMSKVTIIQRRENMNKRGHLINRMNYQINKHVKDKYNRYMILKNNCNPKIQSMNLNKICTTAITSTKRVKSHLIIQIQKKKGLIKIFKDWKILQTILTCNLAVIPPMIQARNNAAIINNNINSKHLLIYLNQMNSQANKQTVKKTQIK